MIQANAGHNMDGVVRYDVGDLFFGKSMNKYIFGYAQPTAYTPKHNPKYMFPNWASDIMAWLLSGNEPLYLFGPTGCGKTSCVKQMVAKINYPVYEVTGHNRLEFPELVGHHTVKDGSMHFEYGPLVMAMKYGGVFLINEIDLLDPSTAAGLNSILDGYPLTIPENGGELVEPHPMFRFVATANTNGGSDHTGLYQGTLRQNIAFMDRFILVEADYLPEATEVGILQAQVGLAPAEKQPQDGSEPVYNIPTDVLTKMVKYANAIRAIFMGTSTENANVTMDVTFSTRTLIRWATLAVVYQPLSKSGLDVLLDFTLDRSLALRAAPATRIALKEIAQRMFNIDTSKKSKQQP